MRHWYAEREQELLSSVHWARLAARSFANKAGRWKDKAFVDECEAEAIFILTVIIYEDFEHVLAEFPEEAARHRFYYSSAKYKLKDYFSYRASSTISFLKKRGITVEFEPSEQHRNSLARTDTRMSEYEILDSALRNDFEREVFELRCLGDHKKVIAEKLGVSVKRVQTVLRDIRRRIQT